MERCRLVLRSFALMQQQFRLVWQRPVRHSKSRTRIRLLARMAVNVRAVARLNAERLQTKTNEWQNSNGENPPLYKPGCHFQAARQHFLISGAA